MARSGGGQSTELVIQKFDLLAGSVVPRSGVPFHRCNVLDFSFDRMLAQWTAGAPLHLVLLLEHLDLVRAGIGRVVVTLEEHLVRLVWNHRAAVDSYAHIEWRKLDLTGRLISADKVVVSVDRCGYRLDARLAWELRVHECALVRAFFRERGWVDLVLSLDELFEVLVQHVLNLSLLIEIALRSLLPVFVKLPLCRDGDLFLDKLIFDV